MFVCGGNVLCAYERGQGRERGEIDIQEVLSNMAPGGKLGATSYDRTPTPRFSGPADLSTYSRTLPSILTVFNNAVVLDGLRSVANIQISQAL